MSVVRRCLAGVGTAMLFVLGGCIGSSSFYQVSAYHDELTRKRQSYARMDIGSVALYVHPVTRVESNFGLISGVVPASGLVPWPLTPMYYPRQGRDVPYVFVEVLVDTIDLPVELDLSAFRLVSAGVSYPAVQFERLGAQIGGPELRETEQEKGRINRRASLDYVCIPPGEADSHGVWPFKGVSRDPRLLNTMQDGRAILVPAGNTGCFALRFPVAVYTIHPFTIMVDGVGVAGRPISRREFLFLEARDADL